MAKIYEFPQGADRNRLKREIASERKKRLKEKTGNPLLKYIKYIKWIWFYLRLLTAGTLHLISVVTLAILGAFSTVIFWVGGLICVVTWFHLEHQFWTAQNFTIPVIGGMWVLSLLSAPLVELMNKRTPWYRLLVPDATEAHTDNEHE